MFETISVFFAGLATAYLLTWPGLIALFILGILFEHNGARGWAVFTGIVSIAVGYFFFAVPLADLAIYAVGYVLVGLVWSFWRYKRFVETEVASIKERISNPETRRTRAEDLHPTKNLDTITAWILIWPFSAVESVVGDVINVIQTLVQKVFKGVYHKIYTSATADLI